MLDSHLEAEYNNRLKVPHHPAIMAEWKAKSAAFRASHTNATIDVRYGDTDRQALDVFWPGHDRSVPLALFVHGGYWQALDKSWFSHLAAGFNANGIALAIPSYDLCPSVGVETIVEEIRRAAAFLMNSHETDLYATGHSAGGHLTAMLLATDWAAFGSSHVVTGGCAISGLFDLIPLVNTSINGALCLDTVAAARLSPINLTAPKAHLYAFVGDLEGEEYTHQSASIAEAWRGTFGTVAGADHFTAIAPLEFCKSEMMQVIVAEISASRA